LRQVWRSGFSGSRERRRAARWLWWLQNQANMASSARRRRGAA